MAGYHPWLWVQCGEGLHQAAHRACSLSTPSYAACTARHCVVPACSSPLCGDTFQGRVGRMLVSCGRATPADDLQWKDARAALRPASSPPHAWRGLLAAQSPWPHAALPPFSSIAASLHQLPCSPAHARGSSTDTRSDACTVQDCGVGGCEIGWILYCTSVTWPLRKRATSSSCTLLESSESMAHHNALSVSSCSVARLTFRRDRMTRRHSSNETEPEPCSTCEALPQE